MNQNAVKLAIEKAGGMRPLARAIGIAHQAIAMWTYIPIKRLLDVERVTGIPREILRPDIFYRSVEEIEQ